MIKLILNNKEYPNAFENHPGENVPTSNKQDFFEKKLISTLNHHNSKLKVEQIEYSDTRGLFKLTQKRSAVIVQENSQGQQILAYVFLSPNTDDSRNILVAQSIFPDLVDTIENYINAPHFTMLNMPIYFINMIDKKIESSSIIRDFALLNASEFNYIELFHHSLIEKNNNGDNLIQFKRKFFDDLGLENKFFQLDLPSKKIKIFFPVDELLNATQTDFNGSNEKFYWTQILLISIIASKNNYTLDILDYEGFITNYENQFSSSSLKLSRCKIILAYLKKLQRNSYENMQIIYYGAPGTGKSFKIDKMINDKNILDENVFRTTFHPEFTYSDFIGQLLPTVQEDDNGNTLINYTYNKGVFTQALEKAYQNTSINIYLILEEMSRGDVAAIFGDTFQLLDRISSGHKKGYSRYSINNDIVSKDIIALLDNKIMLPPNLFLFGTVNTSDQNVFVMDTAFKRRFEWEYVSTKPVKDEKDVFLNNVDVILYNSTNELTYEWVDFYVKLNKFISSKDYLDLGEDKQIGQFFIEFNNSDSETIKNMIKNKLLHFLWSDVHKASFKRDVSLFSDDISSFSDLYDRFSDNNDVFSDEFIQLLNS